ncbi:hypothetical protein BAE44_0023135 [Dichanthelium oligosanthes]|uniref:Uncharacterized protein n=1 Tax=Dichanthelium oligosanthes TaxID=888268 RepID=A0A1E5USS2_9POAL|nr:hypothetical protein BAE44_0023135 [Dichanthelium oligosanthes]
MLGFIRNRIDEGRDPVARFVPACSFRLPPHADLRNWRALDARHGRVLLRTVGNSARHLVVWCPVTAEWRQLLKGPLLPYGWNAAVLCTGAACGTCDHLDCHRGPFLVVFLGTSIEHMTLWVYSSEFGVWSGPTYAAQFPKYYVNEAPSAIVGTAIHTGEFSSMVWPHGKSLSSSSLLSPIGVVPQSWRRRMAGWELQEWKGPDSAYG